MNPWVLMCGVLFSSVGVGFFIYGKKQKTLMPFVCGLALMVFPYFVSNTAALVAIGTGLIALPYFVKI